MLDSIINQQPDLFKNVAKHWQVITGSDLLLLSANGLPLANPGSAPARDFWPALIAGITGPEPVFITEHQLLIAPLVFKGQPAAFLVAPETPEHHLALLRWVADSLLARVIDLQAMQTMSTELVNARDQLELTFRVAENLAFAADLTTVFKSILEEIQKVTRTADGFILLQQPEGLHCVAIGDDHLFCYRSLLRNLTQASQIVTRHTPVDCRQFWPKCPAEVHNLLATALAGLNGDMQAAVGLVNKSTGNFNAGDAKILAALAQQVATIINHHFTHHQLVVKERVNREQEIAVEIQESLRPIQLPQMGGISMAVSSVPALEVGGDFYDFITLGDRYLTIVIGDVSGKGISAAMFTSITRTILRSEAMRGEAPHHIIRQVHNLLYPDLSRVDSFVTVFLAILDTCTGSLTYASAGHPPALLWRAKTQKVEQLKATSLPIGIFNLPDSQSHAVQLAGGDTLVFYTDGITEAQSLHGDLFGLNRLIYIVESHGSDPPEKLQLFIQSEVNSFRCNTDWRDDATLLVLKMLAQAESPTPQNISTKVKTVEFQYPADMDYLSEISQQVASTCRQLTALPNGSRGDDFIYLIELAISEICTNIVKHAYAGAVGRINGKVTLLNNGVQFDFYDLGAAFDPNSVPEPEPDPTPNNLREGGYGLHIVRQIMDVVSYESHPNTGNHWHLIKFLPAQK